MAKIYLAGPIEHALDGGVDWRREAQQYAAGHKLIDPTHHDGGNPTVGWREKGLTAAEIVTRDRYLLRQSDGVIFDARSETAAWGTPMELLDAYQLGKPTVGWGAPEYKSAFLEHHCTKFFDRLEDAMDYMVDLLERTA